MNLHSQDDWITVKSSNIKGRRTRLATAGSFSRKLNQTPTEYTVTDDHVQRVFKHILDCMRSIQAYLEVDNQTKVFHLDNLVSIIQNTSSATRNNPDDNKILDHIVCYGIGNFHEGPCTSPPMIQLACALLLRRSLCSPISLESQWSPLDFAFDQSLLPIFYFEPNLHPVEKIVLTEYIHMNIISSNEQGKREICGNHLSNKHTHCPSVLFYMPHCPMRLYSNLLWANWHVIGTARFFIFGNSFKVYDDRIVDSRIRKDPTNCLFPILPFVVEQSVLESPTVRMPSQNGYDQRLSDCFLEAAFIDCSVMYFRISDGLSRPERPQEYISNNYEDELL